MIEQSIDNIKGEKVIKQMLYNDLFQVYLEQGSNEWLEFRKKRITATDISFIMEAFVKKVKYYDKYDVDFFEYKTINKRKISEFIKARMEEGHIIEKHAEKHVSAICDRLNSISKGKNIYRYEHGIVLEKNKWLMASYDYMIYKNDEFHCPVEVKNINKLETFNKCLNFDSPFYHQLAAQMIISNCKRGMILLYSNFEINSVEVREIKLDNKYITDIVSNIEVIKNIYKDVIIDKVNPCRDKLKDAEKLAKKILEVEELEDKNNEINSNIADISKEIEDFIAKKTEEINVLRLSLTEDEFIKSCKQEYREKLLKYMKDNSLKTFNEPDSGYSFTHVVNPGKFEYIRIIKQNSVSNGNK